MKQNSISRQSAQRGVVLIEAMVAILLFAVGVLAVAGLQASMIRNSSDSQYRTEASYIAQQKIGQMWSDPNLTNAAGYNMVDQAVPSLPGGFIDVTQTVAAGPYTISVRWTLPGQDQHSYTTTAVIDPPP
jgi:type IV pilus assembly protein PilV